MEPFPSSHLPLPPLNEIPYLDWQQDDFAAWLRDAALVTVGFSCVAGECPLAEWQRQIGNPCMVISTVTFAASYSPTTGWGLAPVWVHKFVNTLDKEHGFRNVSGSTCLAVLKTIDHLAGERNAGNMEPTSV